MTLSLYNTRTRQKEPFAPLQPGRVTMYVCGPTVYSFPHIGNARPAVVFDVLARLLRTRYQLIYARNITDIDDKINRAAAAEGVPIGEIAARYAKAYHADMRALGVLAPDIEPRATEHLASIIRMISGLIDSGHAYTAEGHVLFRVAPLRTTAACRGAISANCWPVRGSKSHLTRKMPATSCCGNPRRRTCPAGTAPGGAAGPAGTSSARRWWPNTSVPPSISTVAATT